MKDLGVKIERGRSLSLGDITLQVINHFFFFFLLKHFQNLFLCSHLQGLKDQGYQGVFIGIGLPQAKRIPIFQNLNEQMGFYTSKDFLPKVSVASKPGMRSVQPADNVRVYNLVGAKTTKHVRVSLPLHRNVQVQIRSAVATRQRDRPGSRRHGFRLRHVRFALRR